MPPDFLTGTCRYRTRNGLEVLIKDRVYISSDDDELVEFHGYEGIVAKTIVVIYDEKGNAIDSDDRDLDLIEGIVPRENK